MLAPRVSAGSLAFVCLAACATKPPPAGAETPSAGPAPALPTTPSADPGAAASSEPAPSNANAIANANASGDCGALDCKSFATSKEAFDVVLAQKPLALGIGEAHAQKGSDNVESATKRFTDELLPELKGKASFLLVELMMPNDKCKKETKQVRKQQQPVTKPQAETNQNEYVVLGTHAKQLGIVPDLLRPSCDDLTRITQAGEGDIDVMLQMIAKLTTNVVEGELDRNQKAGKHLMVVSYGGALHNDLTPKAGHEAWSYGPALAKKTDGRYVELDLIVPEYIKDTEAWTSLPWYAHYDRKKLGQRAVLFRVAPSSYALIFPESPSAPAPDAKPE